MACKGARAPFSVDSSRVLHHEGPARKNGVVLLAVKPRSPLTLAEALAAAAFAAPALTTIAAYLIDGAGFRFLPWLMLAFALVVAIVVFAWSMPRDGSNPVEATAFISVVVAVFAGAMWT